ncbi:hypothetical protein HYQ46_003430 [Verticillium longisporum]|nr:hypothetical protein HYQ46_003430 [Verticillium longisporum]
MPTCSLRFKSASHPCSSAEMVSWPIRYEMNPLQQREAMQREQAEKKKAELLAKATGTAGQSGQWVAQNWLRMPPPSVE